MKVSIITATFNSATTVADTLQSVANQDYPNIEHIIIDGLSNDKTLEIVKSYPHVSKVVSEKDKGIYDAMNKGISHCTGDIIGILNSDDFYATNDVVSQMVKAIGNRDTLYGDLDYVHEKDTRSILRKWRSGNYNRNAFRFGWMPPHPTFFVKKEVYSRFGDFNLSLKSAADYELMLRFLFKNEVSTTYLPKVVVKMRAGGQSNVSFSNRVKANKEDQKAWELNGLSMPWWFPFFKPLRKIGQFFRG